MKVVLLRKLEATRLVTNDNAQREGTMTMKSTLRGALCAAGLVLASSLAWAEAQYGPGVSDTEIKIGNTMPYSGPASAYAVIGKAEAAYFAMVNDQGGINGRKINFISRDDGYSPPKTVEVVRKLVEQDQVLLIFNSLGTAPNLAIRGYLNDNRVPHLFVASGAETWNDPTHFPWSMGYGPSYRLEGRIYGRYILKNMPDAKIGVLYQNDDLGKDYLAGLREGLADQASKLIIATQSYETSDTTTDSQIAAIQGSGANTLLTAAIPKFAAQTIRKVYDIGWKPTHFLSVTAISVKQVMQPAGVEKGVGIISATYGKEVSDPQWHDAPDYKEWLAWMKKYNPSADINDNFYAYGYSAARTLTVVLKACGDDLTRESVIKHATNIYDDNAPLALPGMVFSTSPKDYALIKQMQLIKFDGTTWKLFGELISGAIN
jgi:ABC-type branched-subunit amino acid transport system substrate-binding protein